MNEYDEKWEAQINALLEGKLSEADAERLKAAAGDDENLARAIVEACQLQQAMDTVQLERAPASLRKKLRAIPRQNSPVLLQPRWALALAAIPLVLIVTSLLQPQKPTDSEIAQARQDLVLALSYLDKAVGITGHEIETTVGRTMTDAIAGSAIRNIKPHNQSSKEKEA